MLSVEYALDRGLDRVALRAVARPQRGIEVAELGAGAPMVVQGLRRGRDLICRASLSACMRVSSESGNAAFSPITILRLRTHPPQQPQHGRFRHRDTSRRRSENSSRARCRNTALPRPAMRGARVVIDLDNEIVEVILARQPVAGLVADQPDRLIVMAVVPGLRTRRLRAGSARTGRKRARARMAVGAPPQLPRMEGASRACRRRPPACWPGCRRGRARPAWSSRPAVSQPRRGLPAARANRGSRRAADHARSVLISD